MERKPTSKRQPGASKTRIGSTLCQTDGSLGEKSGAKEKKTVKRRLPVSKTRIETAIRDLLEKWEADGGKAKPAVSVADFIRLVQLQKELKAEQRPKEIKVTWVEPEEKDPDPEN